MERERVTLVLCVQLMGDPHTGLFMTWTVEARFCTQSHISLWSSKGGSYFQGLRRAKTSFSLSPCDLVESLALSCFSVPWSVVLGHMAETGHQHHSLSQSRIRGKERSGDSQVPICYTHNFHSSSFHYMVLSGCKAHWEI